MADLVVNGASLTCSMGTTPSSMVVTPVNLTKGSSVPAANVMDYVPMTNIMPFGMCTTLSNPQVATATSAANGVLSPQPCIPVTTAPWVPGSPTVRIRGQSALNSDSQCMCQWGGAISVTVAGQATIRTA